MSDLGEKAARNLTGCRFDDGWFGGLDPSAHRRVPLERIWRSRALRWGSGVRARPSRCYARVMAWLLLLVSGALGGVSPCELPVGEELAAWQEPLAMAGICTPGAVSQARVRFEDLGVTWRVVVVDVAGCERAVTAAAPGSQEDREDLAWLAASLAMPLNARLAALQAAVELRDSEARDAPVTIDAPGTPVPSPPLEVPVVLAEPPPDVAAAAAPAATPVLATAQDVPAGDLAVPAPAQPPAPLGEAVLEPTAPGSPGVPFRASLGGAGTAGLGAGLSVGADMELALRPRDRLWIGLAGTLRPSVGLGSAAASRDFSERGLGATLSLQLGSAVWIDGRVSLAHREFTGALDGQDAGWMPLAGLGLSYSLPLAHGLAVVPGLRVEGDLRGMEMTVGDTTVDRLQPIWASIALGLSWQGMLGAATK